MSKAEERAREYAENTMLSVNHKADILDAYWEGYEQAAQDLAPAFEYPFDVPDNDGFLVFTPMTNETIRKELKLKKGERVIISIRKEK